MKPTDELKTEHGVIGELLMVMDSISDRLDAGEKVEPQHLLLVVSLIREYADRWHHAKEEGLLFPALEQAGIPREGGPLGMMEQEHGMGRQLVAVMEEAASRYAGGDRDAGLDFAEAARNYVGLLSLHIGKENDILFPMADDRLSAEKQAELEAAFHEAQIRELGPERLTELMRSLDMLKEVYLG